MIWQLVYDRSITMIYDLAVTRCLICQLHVVWSVNHMEYSSNHIWCYQTNTEISYWSFIYQFASFCNKICSQNFSFKKQIVINKYTHGKKVPRTSTVWHKPISDKLHDERWVGNYFLIQIVAVPCCHATLPAPLSLPFSLPPANASVYQSSTCGGPWSGDVIWHIIMVDGWGCVYGVVKMWRVGACKTIRTWKTWRHGKHGGQGRHRRNGRQWGREYMGAGWREGKNDKTSPKTLTK